MALERYEDWPARMREAIAMAGATPFAWGRHDCALFACTVVAAMTGTDPASHLRGTYATEAEAKAIIAANGGSLEAMAAAIAAGHGMPEVAVNFAQRGDLLLAQAARGHALGIVTGDTAAFAGPGGVYRIPVFSRGIRAWKV